VTSLYRGPIIDAHHHLWDLGMDRHPWLRPKGGEIEALGDLGPIRRDYLVADYLRDAAHQPIIATVHVEAAWDKGDDPLAESRWIDGLDKSRGVAERMIAYAPLATPDVEPILDALAAMPRCVGIRQMLSWHPREPAKCFAPGPDLADNPAWRCGVALMMRRGLMLELMLYPYQAEAVLRLARDFPDLRIILNHCGSPIDRDEPGMARWRDGLRLLAQAPNIDLKISALAAYDAHPTPASLKAVTRHCIDCFGAGRTMFGSDFPVGRLWTSFDAIFDGFRTMVQDLSADEQRALFHDNARRIYRFA
jgi:predicted TIM-barrel fold metal-dependent hydrolase